MAIRKDLDALASILTFLIILVIPIKTETYFRKGSDLRVVNTFSKYSNPSSTINKVTLTQKGYIQFLRYITEVPSINEFTFCIWLRSANLTYSHPLLSYSKHETDRYIRAWISPYGKEINLVILENEIFKIPVYFLENRWYHICQSWEPISASWSFYLNGKLKLSGHQPKLRNLLIPKGGDMVVGQEFTDFDKGLDDGIEGDIFGFNLILASTTSNPYDLGNNLISPYEFSQRRIFGPNYPNYVPRYHPNGYQHHNRQNFPHNHRHEEEEIPSVLSYFTALGANRTPKGIYEFGQSLYESFLGWLNPQEKIRIKTNTDEFNRGNDRRIVYSNGPSLYPPQDWVNKRIITGNSRIVNDITGLNDKPLGLQLVELSYNCALGKGSPINHEKVLVSWTKTPVRVFGGAILKNVTPFCWKNLI